MVLKNLIILIYFICLFFSNISHSSQIFDYETELFINQLLIKIKSVNEFQRDIKVYIIKDKNPNAFVVTNSKIVVSSGLIEKSPDYVSLLAVLAHEIGHIQYFHLEKRKDSLEQFSKINLISNLALITGGILANEPQVLGGAVASQANINNFYLSFGREQEREADLYSIETLEKLNLPSKSIIQLLKILENNSLSRGFDEDFQKFSTHPIFRERYSLIESNSKTKKSNFDSNTERDFKFIKAKFLAHNNNLGFLENDHKIYYESINNSKLGNLKNSLEKINLLIRKYPEYIFLLETKGDILRSHGYINESIKFYKIVLNEYPDNHYVKYKIFLDTNLNSLQEADANIFFYNNLNLLIQFPKNKYIINKFEELAINLDKNYWIIFLNIIKETDNISGVNLKEKLFKLSEKTDDTKLKKIIYDYLKI